ncbi:MAG: leucine-rich repeat domain-containing protein [Bacteroidaceae bacterium]|nr:leucine-rich repeat domain-containing protein [Bacteroidaceae bacterium]
MKTKILSAILIALLTLPAMAYDYEENGIGYTINNSTKSVSVTGYNSSVIAQNEGVVNIPEAISFNGRTYSVTSIGERAFSGYTGITSITIPSSVTSIGDLAFHGCTSLTSITIPPSIAYIGKYPFAGCENLNSVHITDLAAWCKIRYPYAAETGFRSQNAAESNPLSYAHNLYLNGELLTDLIIPDSITSIGNFAFVNCTSLKSITIPNSFKAMGTLTFYGCTGLEGIYISDLTVWCNIKYYDYYYESPYTPLQYAKRLFLNEKEVTDLIIPDSLTTINSPYFKYLKNLKSITIPSSFTSFGNYAFWNCPNITSIYSFAVNPPSISSDTFDNNVVKTKATLYVLPEAISAYQNHTYWKQFWIEEMDESMTGIEDVKISSDENAPIYDLYGRRIIGKPQGGQIYIRNGKKALAM